MPASRVKPFSRPAVLTAALAGVFAAVSCHSDRLTSMPPSPGALRPTAEILDGAHRGNRHFFFLPPLVPSPSHTGITDPGVSPRVVVCEWRAADQGGQCVTIVAQFTTTNGTGDVVRYDAAEQAYHVNWKTDQCVSGSCSLDPQKAYRLRVLVGAAELGFADVVVVSNASAIKNVETGETIALVNGRTLPVKFRIEQGAVAVVAPGGSASVGAGGGLVATADGSVAIDIPSGALGSSTPITAALVPAPAPTPDVFSPIVELGPDGTTFASPVTLTLAFDRASVPSGVSDSDIGIYTFDGTGWEPVPGAVVRSADNTVSAPISHFSFYVAGVYPRTTNYVSAPTILKPTQTTTMTAFVGYCVGHWSCTVRPLVNVAVNWSSSNAAVLAVPPGPTYTNSRGEAQSGIITARAPGTPDVIARTFYTTATHRLTILNPLHLVPGSRQMTATFVEGQSVNADFANPTDVDISVGNRGQDLLVSEPGTSNYTYNNSTGTYRLPANTRSKLLSLAALIGPGTDTIVVSAAGHASDTAFITVVKAKFLVTGWPTQLAQGDSAPLTVTVADVNDRPGSLAFAIDAALAPSSGLVFTDGRAPISTLRIQQRESATFYVKATAQGAQSATISQRYYDDYRNTITVGPPRLQGPQAVCGHKITGIAYDGTYYWVGEGHDGLLQCLSRFSVATGYLVDTRQIFLDHRGLNWVQSLGRVTSRTWGGPIYSIDYSTGGLTQLASNPTASRPGDEQSAPAVDADGQSYWILNGAMAERRRLSDHTLLKTFAVTPSAGFNSIAASDRFVFVLDGAGVNAYSKATGAPAGRQPLPHVHPCEYLGFGVSANADRIMYLSDCRHVEVVPVTVQFVDSPWSTAASMITPRWGMTAVAVGNTIFTIGGNPYPQEPYPGGSPTGVVEAYDLTTNSWSARASMPAALEHMMAAAVNGKIYVFGGWLCNLCGDRRTFIYNIALNSWTQGPDVPNFVNGGVAAEINGRIYITTGSCCGTPDRGFFEFDPTTNTFRQLPSMPRTHASVAGAGVIAGKLYVAGGESSFGSLDVYDPVAGVWTSKRAMPVNRQHGAGAVVNGKLYIFGGENDGGSRAGDDVYAYDPASDSWSVVAQVPVQRNLPAAVTLGGTVFLLGGNGGAANPPGAPIGRVDRYFY